MMPQLWRVYWTDEHGREQSQDFAQRARARGFVIIKRGQGFADANARPIFN